MPAAHYPQLTAHYLMLTAHCSLPAALWLLLTAHCTAQVGDDSKETLLALFILLLFALAASGYVFKRGVEKGDRTTHGKCEVRRVHEVNKLAVSTKQGVTTKE